MLVTVRITANNACYGEDYANNACYGENFSKQCLSQQNCVLRVGILHTGARPGSSPGLSAKHACCVEIYGKQCLSQQELRPKTVYYCGNRLTAMRVAAEHAWYVEGDSNTSLLR